jgi:2-oxo-4-hydroxy-4-carboxy-5-ureidoimidazoline decarboxylase
MSVRQPPAAREPADDLPRDDLPRDVPPRDVPPQDDLAQDDLAQGDLAQGDLAQDAEPPWLAEFNGLPGGVARRALLACCSSARWADGVEAGRPYGSVAGLLRRSDEATADLAPADLSDALSGHPRIGERIGGGADRWSRQEQAGMDEAAELTRRALADGNLAYERRFGHIYLVCATGRNAGELLDLLRARLGNDGETEWRVVRSELKKINRIRLRKLMEGGA